VGVIASGLLTDGPGWRWVFLINVPVGVLLITSAAIFLPVDARGGGGARGFDVAGAVTVTGGLLLLIYGVNRARDVGWGSASTVGLFAASVAMLSSFVVIETRTRSPLVPGSSVRNRTLVAANLSAFFIFGAFFAFLFLGSLLMQQVLGYSPTRTGVAWLATSATSFIAAAITGAKLVAEVGVRRLLVVGLSLLAISGVLLTHVHAGGNFATDLLPALVLAGVAGGLSAPAAQIGALAGVSNSMTGLASGLVETTREIGGAIGVAAVSTVLISCIGKIHGRRPGGAWPGYGERLPWRVLGDIHRRSPRCADGRDHLPAAHNTRDRARARLRPTFRCPRNRPTSLTEPGIHR
jgi:predicted MFS family arabinose efflux permease